MRPNGILKLKIYIFDLTPLSAKALKELGEFQEAIDTLERAEDISKEQAKIVQKYKLEMIEEHKKSILKLNE